MPRSLFFVLVVACNSEHSLVSSELDETEQASEEQAADQRAEVSQSREASLSYQQERGSCADRELGTFVAESYVRYTVNPTADKSKTLVGNNKLRHTITMENTAGQEVFVQPVRPTYGDRFLVDNGTVNGDDTVFTLNNNPLDSHNGQGCHITIHGYQRGSYQRFYCINGGIRTDGREVIIPTNKLNGLDAIVIYYKDTYRPPFLREFTLRGQHINANSLRVNDLNKYFTFDSTTNKLKLMGKAGEHDWHYTHNYIFEGTKMIITYNTDKLSYDLAADANVFNLGQTRCFANNRAINCTVSNGKVHFQGDDFENNKQVVVNLKLRTKQERKVPLGEGYLEGSAVLTFEGNTCEDDENELEIDADNNVLIDTAEAKSACPMLVDFDDNNESITVTYNTFTHNEDDLIIESGFFARHQHNASCYELWIKDTEKESDSYKILGYSAVSPDSTGNPDDPPERWLPFDANAVFKVFLLHKPESE